METMGAWIDRCVSGFLRNRMLMGITAAVLLLIGAVWTGAWIWAKTIFGNEDLALLLSQYLSNRLGQTVTVASADIRISLTHGLALHARKVRMIQTDQSSVYLNVGDAHVGLSLTDIVNHKLIFESLALGQVELGMARSVSGDWTLPLQSGIKSRSAETEFPVELALTRIQAKDVTLTLDDRMHQRKLRYPKGYFKTSLYKTPESHWKFPLHAGFTSGAYLPDGQAAQKLPWIELSAVCDYDPLADALDIADGKIKLPGFDPSLAGQISGFRSVIKLSLDFADGKVNAGDLVTQLPSDWTHTADWNYSLKANGTLEAHVSGLANPIPEVKGTLALKEFVFKSPKFFKIAPLSGKSTIRFTQDGFELTQAELNFPKTQFSYWITMPSYFEKHFIFFVETPRFWTDEFYPFPSSNVKTLATQAEELTHPASGPADGLSMPEDLRLDGTLHMAEAIYAEQSFKNISAKINAYHQYIQLENGTLSGFDADLSYNLQFNASNPEQLFWQGQAAVSGLYLDKYLTWLWGSPYIHGKLDGDFKFTGQGLTWPTLRQNLYGYANLEITHPVYDHLPGIVNIAQTLKWDRLNNVIPSSDLTLSIKVADGKVFISQLELEFYNFTSRSTGWIGLDKSFAFDTATVIASEATDEFIGQLGPAISPLKTRMGDLKASFKTIAKSPNDVNVELQTSKKAFPNNAYLSGVKIKKASLYDNPFFKDDGDSDDAGPNKLFGGGEDAASSFFGGAKKEDKPKEESPQEKAAREKRLEQQRQLDEEDQKLKDLKEQLPF